MAADVAWRSRALATGGLRMLLETFRPMITWRAPVMEVDYPVDRDLRLEGRGLLLVPSYFCWRRPIALVDETLPPVLVYPVDKTVVPDTPVTPAKLVKLLGPTRAGLLYETAARSSVSTSTLAGTVLVSLPSVSQQLTVLREAGLVTSHRDGKYVLHSVTPPGPATARDLRRSGQVRSRPTGSVTRTRSGAGSRGSARRCDKCRWRCSPRRQSSAATRRVSVVAGRSMRMSS